MKGITKTVALVSRRPFRSREPIFPCKEKTRFVPLEHIRQHEANQVGPQSSLIFGLARVKNCISQLRTNPLEDTPAHTHTHTHKRTPVSFVHPFMWWDSYPNEKYTKKSPSCTAAPNTQGEHAAGTRFPLSMALPPGHTK